MPDRAKRCCRWSAGSTASRNMKERELLRHVFDHDIIGDDVALKSRDQLLTDIMVAIDKKRIAAVGVNENIRVDFPLRR